MAENIKDFEGGHSTGIVPPWRRGATSAARLAPADLMGRGDAAVLPRLDGTVAEYRITHEDHRAILLARGLTMLGIAEPQDWDGTERSTSGYILATLKRWIECHGGGLIRQQFALCASISSAPDPYTDDGADRELLYLIVNPDSAAYVVIGPTLELLGANDRRLAVSFYRLFVDAVRCWVRVYDYEDAQDRLEMLREWLEGDENSEEYELPDVENCIPVSMKEKPLDAEIVRHLGRETKNKTVRRILTAALDLDQLSQKVRPAAISEETREAFMDSNPPLPALLVSFRRHDAIAACFDEEGQAMMETEPEPNLIVEIDPGEASSVQKAFELLGNFCDTMAAASQLASMLPGNEEA
jgi:hypothetical protein